MMHVVTGMFIGFYIGFLLAEAMFKGHVAQFADMIVKDNKLVRLGDVYAVIPMGLFERMSALIGITASTKIEDE